MNRCVNGLEMTLICLQHCTPCQLPRKILSRLELSTSPECHLWKLLTAITFNEVRTLINETNRCLIEQELEAREPDVCFDGWSSLPLELELQIQRRANCLSH